MIYKFKKSSFIFAVLPAAILTCFVVWLIPAMYSITFKGPLPSDYTIIEFGLDIFLLSSPLLFMIFLVPTYILAFQYWSKSRNLEVKLDFEHIEIKNSDTAEKFIFNKSDINKIVSISPIIKHHRLFSSFSYLVVFSKNTKAIIPCFVVTKDVFLQNFGPFDNLAEGFPYTPFIKEKIYSRVEKASKFNISNLEEVPIQVSGRYLNLLRSLLIPGLALLLYIAYQMSMTWFLTISILTLFIYFILLTQKKIFITKTDIIVKYFGIVRTYPVSSIQELKELKFSGINSISDPLIKIEVTDKEGSIKAYFFFPRDNAFPELRKILHHDK